MEFHQIIAVFRCIPDIAVDSEIVASIGIKTGRAGRPAREGQPGGGGGDRLLEVVGGCREAQRRCDRGRRTFGHKRGRGDRVVGGEKIKKSWRIILFFLPILIWGVEK